MIDDFERRENLRSGSEQNAEAQIEEFEERVMQLYTQVEKRVKAGLDSGGVERLKALNFIRQYKVAQTKIDKIRAFKVYGFNVEQASRRFQDLLIEETGSALQSVLEAHFKKRTLQTSRDVTEITEA